MARKNEVEVLPDSVESAEIPEKKEVSKRKGTPPALTFNQSGWCEELGRSYFQGHFQPSDWKEYDALKGYSVSGGEK